MDSYTDNSYTHLERIIPFSLPSLQCSEELRTNHITMQTLRMTDQLGKKPEVGLEEMMMMMMMNRLEIRLFSVFIYIFGTHFVAICINSIILIPILCIILLARMM